MNGHTGCGKAPTIIVPYDIDKAMLIMMGLHSHSIDQVPLASPLRFAREAISNDVGRKTRSIALLYARNTSRNFLRGLLLGLDAFDVRCWYWKHWLDAGLRGGDGH